jgi:hypothetical protein
MSAMDRWKAGIRAEYNGEKFSAILDTYMDLKAHGPKEDFGHTDKDYYYRMDVLRNLMDEKVCNGKL